MDKLSLTLVVFIGLIIISTTLNGVKSDENIFHEQLIDEKLFYPYLIKFNSFNNSSEGLVMDNSSKFKIMGVTDYGYVTREGPYGNLSSPIKIAYIIGVHPMEWRSHLAIKQAFTSNMDSMKFSYYIYRIQVLKDGEDYDNGRINGQKLASEFAIPDMKNESFNAVVDIHSNRGAYEQKIFIAVLTPDQPSESLARKLVEKLPWIVYYLPPPETGPTSGPYISKPLINSGIPTIVYETFSFEPFELTLEHAVDFVKAVDTLEL